MRDKLKTEEYFQLRIEREKNNIQEFSDLLKTLDTANEIGIRRNKLFLSNFYRNLLKALYSSGEDIEKIIDPYLGYLEYFKDICSFDVSMYDVIDIFSIGVLLEKHKEKFLQMLIEIENKMDKQDGLINCFLSYLQKKEISYQKSCMEYFNTLAKEENKEEVLYLEIGMWYQHHKDAYWYNSHKSKNNTYYGYWCFEIGALVKIFGLDDSRIKENEYYPYDLVHYGTEKV